MYIDSHCHLAFPELNQRLDAILADMRAADVGGALCICTAMDEFESVHALAAAHVNLWASVGVHLEHYTKDQWGEGRSVSRADLKPGDLVFYYPGSLHHVAIYVGGGYVVHAPHTGDVVRMATIDRGPIAGYRRPG